MLIYFSTYLVITFGTNDSLCMNMQNWAHLEAVFEQLNHLPSKEHGTNVMRIRPWYLDQHAQYYRQTILLSSYLTSGTGMPLDGAKGMQKQGIRTVGHQTRKKYT
ncbi:unnamed protein product [Urochloa humidicola]